MKMLLERYGLAIFTIVLIAILIAMAGPFSIRIKEYTLDRVSSTDNIGNEEITNASKNENGDSSGSSENEMDGIYACLYTNGELVLSATEIDNTNRTDIATDYGFCQLQSLDATSTNTIKNTAQKWLGLNENNYNDSILSVNIINKLTPKTCSGFFYRCRKLTEIKNIENIDTSKCTSLDHMFFNCSSLTSLDVSNFNTSKVTDMSGLFGACYKLTSLNVSNFDTRNVSNMSSMFMELKNITSLDLSNFNTKNVTDMSYMFTTLLKLTTLDLSNFDTSNVTTMRGMFTSCTFSTINLNNFNTSNVTDMSFMFQFCSKLTSINLSMFDTSKVTTTTEMFNSCVKLTSVNISSWDMSNVTSLNNMFQSAQKLQRITAKKEAKDKIEHACGTLTYWSGRRYEDTYWKIVK